jgi:hypothetical protein
MSSITDFIQAAVAEQPTKAYAAFSSAIEDKIADAIENKRMEVINTTFNQQTQGEE